MSSVLDSQLVYLGMDAVIVSGDASLVEDESGHSADGTVHGDASLDADSLFGTTLAFDGAADYVSVSLEDAGLADGLSGSAFTLTAWVKPTALGSDTSARKVPNVFLAQGSGGSQDNLEIGIDTGGRLQVYLDDGSGNEPLPLGSGELTAGSWHFVGVVFDAGAVTVQLDDTVYPATASGIAALGSLEEPLLLIGGTEEGQGGLVGAVHDVRLFGSALGADEVAAIKRVDLTTATAPSRQSVVVDFALLDSSGQPTLYIVDGNSNETTTLAIENTSPHALSIPAVAALGADTAPFRLQFRPGVLDADCYALDLSFAGWDASLEEQDDGSGLLLLAPREETVFAAGDSLAFAIEGLEAAAEGGARGTRVMLAFQSLGVLADDGASAETSATLSGYRQAYVHVANQSGRRTTPLVMAFVGSNVVLNDGETQNSFRISIANPTENDVSLSTDPDAPTRFVLALPYGSDAGNVAALVLASDDQTQLSVQAPAGWEVESSELTSQLVWTCTNESAESIPARDHLDFEVTGLVTTAASGQTLLALRYENVPGYWDGHLTAQIEKGPMSYTGTQVGIGVEVPAQTLHVRADSAGADGIGVENQGTGDARLLFLDGSTEKFGVVRPKAGGLLFHDYAAGATRLAIDASGNVGIGTDSPGLPLSLGASNVGLGNTGSGGLAFYTSGGASARVTVDASGNVGIGKTPQSYKLDVNGDVRIGRGGDSGRIWSGYEGASVGLYLYDLDDAATVRFRNDLDGDPPAGSRVNTAGDAYEAIVCGKKGLVGVNTTEPGYTLDVNGSLAAKSATIAGDTSLRQALEVDGDTTLKSSLTAYGNTVLAGALAVSGAATLKSLAELGTVSSRVSRSASGSYGACSGYHWSLGSIRLQWGEGTSSSDDDQIFRFPTAFSSTPYVVLVTRKCINGNEAMHAYKWDKDDFTINRHNDINDSAPFVWFAIGPA